MQTQIFMVHKRHLGLRAPTVLAVGFALTILVGALVLMLPVSAADGQITPFLDALFTAASASCVTGLVTVSTAVHWSVFGKCVILLLIQIGGLGFMSVAAIASFVLRRTITLHERMVMSAGLNLSDGGGIVRLTRRVLFGTFIIEGTGAVLLSCRFVPHYGFPKGITMGVFHAVSAFCNAGFDLMGTPDDPFQSLIGWAEDPLANITLMALIVLGGLGFFVWSDVWDKHSFCRLRLHTKIVLTATAGLLLFGFGWTLLFEWSNPATLGAFDTPHKLLAAAFDPAHGRLQHHRSRRAYRPESGGVVPAHVHRRIARLNSRRHQDRDGGRARAHGHQRLLRAHNGFGVRPDDCAAQHHERRNPAHGRRRALSGRRLCDRRNRGRTVSPVPV